jgi:hypothetical protein
MAPAGERTALELFDAARARCPDHVALEVPPAAGAQHSVVMKRALLGPGFAHVVDPDMLHLGDDVTVQALFQAHTFEDRVLKVDHVHVRDGATVGAALGGDEARTARAGRGVRGRADA